MFKIFKRKKIQRAIDYHKIMRDNLIHATGTLYYYCETHENELAGRSGAENKCVKKLEKLLSKYQ